MNANKLRTRDVEALAELGAAAGGVDGEPDEVEQERHADLAGHALQAAALLHVLCEAVRTLGSGQGLG